MQSIDSAMGNLLSKLDVAQSKALRIAQNNQRFEQAVKRTWNDSPETATYILAHVNGIYFKKDERPRKGPGKHDNHYLLGIYVDDSMAKSELNARREMLVLMLAQAGILIDEIALHSATWGMRERHLFPHAIRDLQRIMNPTCTEDSPGEMPAAKQPNNAAANRHLAANDQSHLLETVKRACCQSFGDYEQAWLLLSLVEGAELVEKNQHVQRRTSYARYQCNFYVAEPDPFVTALQSRKEAIVSKSQDLGLRLCDIRVFPSKPEMSGMKAFPRQGAPIPLISQLPPTEESK